MSHSRGIGGGGGDHGRGSKHHEPGDPPLDELFQPPQQQGDSDGGSSLDERDMPALSLLLHACFALGHAWYWPYSHVALREALERGGSIEDALRATHAATGSQMRPELSACQQAQAEAAEEGAELRAGIKAGGSEAAEGGGGRV